MKEKLSAQALQNSYDELEKKIFERTQELRQANLFLRLQVDERKKAEQKLFHQANHDALTSLPNRSCFLSKVEQTLATAKRHPEHNFALLFIDLDNFKQINDCHGHQAGDEFLIEVSQRLKVSVRENDSVARLGGDEFVVLLELLPDTELAEEIANRVIEKIAQPYQLKGCEVLSGASIGIALFEHDYNDVESIMQDADLAMYQAKALGRGQFVVFEPSMRAKVVSDNLLQSLKQSIDNKLISLTSAPVVSQTTAQKSCQILQGKWSDPSIQELEFDHCQSQLEQAGLRLSYDYELIEQLQGANRHTLVSLLPISTQHLTHLRLTKALINKLQALPNRHLVCLMFAESELIELNDQHFNNIKQLKRAGIKVGIHRFGEGNMTFGLLAKMPVDFLAFDEKLIKSVAANPVESALLSSALELCSQFRIHPVLTGLELEQHVSRANELKVDLISGSLITDKHADSSVVELTVQHRA